MSYKIINNEYLYFLNITNLSNEVIDELKIIFIENNTTFNLLYKEDIIFLRVELKLLKNDYGNVTTHWYFDLYETSDNEFLVILTMQYNVKMYLCENYESLIEYLFENYSFI